MHRSWGPLEPFDNSMRQILGENGVYTHLISDHLHYFEDGGAAYHTRYRSFEFIRGQEYDPWKAMVEPPLERRKEIYASRHYGLDTLNDPAARSQVRLRPELIDRQQGAALLTATARDCRRPSTAAAGGHVPVEPPLAPFGNCAILDLLIPTPVLSREPSLTLSPGSRRLVRS
jgi:hypothetical protein